MKYYFGFSFLLAFAGILSIESCTKDTCNTGSTFQNLGIEIVDSKNDTLHLNVSWDNVNQLPSTYFVDGKLSNKKFDPFGEKWENDFQSVLDWKAQDEKNLLISLLLTKPPQEAYVLRWEFPDRQNYLDCSHPGGPDTYLLAVQFILNSDGTEIQSFEFEEELRKGGF